MMNILDRVHCGCAFACNLINSVLTEPFDFQPPPKLPGIFGPEFQDFVNKWYG